jgi:hypothetical protein
VGELASPGPFETGDEGLDEGGLGESGIASSLGGILSRRLRQLS